MSSAHLPAEIRELPVPQRLALLEQIWNSIVEDSSSIPVSGAHEAELLRRLEKRRQQPDRGIDWDVVKRQLLEEQ